MSGISTHILNTASGKPLANVFVRLFSESGEIGSGVTEPDGRCRTLLPEDAVLTPGTYRLVFDVELVFPGGFYPDVTISFRVLDSSSHYHIPLLISPFGFTTYKGAK